MLLMIFGICYRMVTPHKQIQVSGMRITVTDKAMTPMLMGQQLKTHPCTHMVDMAILSIHNR